MIQKFLNDYDLILADNTVLVYTNALNQFFSYCQKSYNEISHPDIRDWMLHLQSNEQKPSTIRTKIFGIKLFYQYCLEEKVIQYNPITNIPVPMLEDHLPRYLESNQLMLLKQHVQNKARERAIVEVLYTTGIRISELTAMEKEDIIWSERMIHIQKGKRKQARIVLFTRTCEEYLKAYFHSRTDHLPFVFTNSTGTGPISIISIQKKFERDMKKLGFNLTPHTLRHTFAAHLARKGMPLVCIQMLLGHKTTRNTYIYTRLYNHVRKQMYDEWM